MERDDARDLALADLETATQEADTLIKKAERASSYGDWDMVERCANDLQGVLHEIRALRLMIKILICERLEEDE